MTRPTPMPGKRPVPRTPMRPGSPAPGQPRPGNPSGGMRPAPSVPVPGRFGSTPPAKQAPPFGGPVPSRPQMPQAQPGPQTQQPGGAVNRSAVLAELRARLGGTSGGPAMTPPRRRPVTMPKGRTS